MGGNLSLDLKIDGLGMKGLDNSGNIIEGTRLFPNRIVRSLVEKYESRYRAILEEMKRTDEGLKVSGQSYLEYQLSWFGKKYGEENDITLTDKNTAEKEFLVFIESYANDKLHISKEERESFKNKFTRLYNVAFHYKDPNNRIYDKDKMNKFLKKQDIGYKVESEREKEPPRATYWVVDKFDWRADESEAK